MNKGRYKALMDMCGVNTNGLFEIYENDKKIVSKCRFMVNGDTYKFYLSDENGDVLHVLADEVIVGLALGMYTAKVIG